MKRNFFGGLISVLIAEGIGFLSGILSGNSGEVYKSLTLPPLSPPGWVFPVMWVLLYALIGIAFYFVYTSYSAEVEPKRKAAVVYAFQLLVNFSWSIIFFRFKAFGVALAVIIILDLLVLWMIRLFKKIDKISSRMLIPYLIWLLFATYLNIGVYILN